MFFIRHFSTSICTCLLINSFLILACSNTASAYTYKGTTEKPQGHFYDANGNPVSIIGDANGAISFSGDVAEIGSYAFHNCSDLTYFQLPSSVIKIGFFAFSNCDNLSEPICNDKILARIPISTTTYDVAPGITAIASAACRKCTQLTEITLPSTVSTIGESAFSGCSNLTKITIPAQTTTVGDYAFLNCQKLSAIFVESTNISNISSNVFEGVDKTKCVLFVPSGSESRYNNWGFSHVVPTSITNQECGLVVKITGSISKDIFSTINSYIISTKAQVVDLTEATLVEGKFTPENKNTLFKTTKAATTLKLENKDNVVYNGTCENLIITDGYPFGTDEFFSATNAKYSRTMSTTWGTICLPFKVKTTETIQYYTTGTVTEDVLILESASSVSAGQPAIFKRKSGTNYTVSRSSTSTIKNDIIEPEVGNSSENISLYGTYKPLNLEEEGLFYISQDKFWLKTEGKPLIVSPFRAWFSFGTRKADGRSLSIEESENETASLKTIEALTDGSALYFDETGQSIPDLKKGMNIVRLQDGTSKKIWLK